MYPLTIALCYRHLDHHHLFVVQNYLCMHISNCRILINTNCKLTSIYTFEFYSSIQPHPKIVNTNIDVYLF